MLSLLILNIQFSIKLNHYYWQKKYQSCTRSQRIISEFNTTKKCYKAMRLLAHKMLSCSCTCYGKWWKKMMKEIKMTMLMLLLIIIMITAMSLTLFYLKLYNIMFIYKLKVYTSEWVCLAVDKLFCKCYINNFIFAKILVRYTNPVVKTLMFSTNLFSWGRISDYIIMMITRKVHIFSIKYNN